MVKKRRIHAFEVYRTNVISIPMLLLARELDMGCTATATAAPYGASTAAASKNCKQQLLESTLQLIDLKDSFDTHDPASTPSFTHTYMMQPSAVQEMALHNGLLFVLLQSGLCPVFDTRGGKHTRVGYLNQQPEEVIRSLVVNTHDSSVVTVSCLTTDMAVLLHCTSTPADKRSFNKANKASAFCTAGRPILEVVGGWGFVEFDDTCSKALLLNTHSKQYKVYDMTSDYQLLFTLPATDVTDLKLGPDYLLMLQCTQAPTRPKSGQPDDVVAALRADQVARASHVVVSLGMVSQEERQQLAHQIQKRPIGRPIPLLVYAAANGQKLAHHMLMVPGLRTGNMSPFDVLELCGDKLLLKVPFKPFEVYDVLTMQLCGCSNHEFLSQVSNFLYLQPQHMFMTVCEHTLTPWNFKCEMVAQFDDNELWYPGMHHSNTVYITDQWVVSLCRAKASRTRLPAASEPGSIHISHLTSGRLVASVTAAAHVAASGCADELDLSEGSPKTQLARALTDVTSLLFVEDGSRIYTGNQQGVVHLWAPGRSDYG